MQGFYVKNLLELLLTYDTPESNDSARMLVLDLEVWVKGNTVRHGFYKKDISNEFTIMSKSALSESTKSKTFHGMLQEDSEL